MKSLFYKLDVETRIIVLFFGGIVLGIQMFAFIVAFVDVTIVSFLPKTSEELENKSYYWMLQVGAILFSMLVGYFAVKRFKLPRRS